MREIVTIFRKEMTDTLRDRRTLFIMILFPLLLLPLILGLMSSVSSSQNEKAADRQLTVALIDNGNAARLGELLRQAPGILIRTDLGGDSLRNMVADGRLDGAYVVASNFDERVADNRPGTLLFYYKSGNGGSVVGTRLRASLESFESELREQRFAALNLDAEMIRPYTLNDIDVATNQEKFGKILGGMLPYMFIIFCFMGGMYPAIDLAAGEKERHTLETLLTSPATPMQILMGKFGVVTLAGVLSACFAVTGLYIGVSMESQMPEELMQIFASLLAPARLLLLLSLILPLSAFFAGILLLLSIQARSFKEAQSLITPMVFAAIIPGVIGMIPGIELNTLTAIVPVLNVALTTKAILAGTLEMPLLLLVYGSLLLFGTLSLFAASRWFFRESVLFSS